MSKISFLFLMLIITSAGKLFAQRGYYDAPYIRYEADKAILSTGAVATAKSYAQVDLQSEASEQVCVDMKNTDATAEFTFSEVADGLVLRYSVPDGESAVVGLYEGDQKISSLTLTSKWSWEYLWSNGDPNNVGITNHIPRMRFDEVRYKLPNKLTALKLVKESGNLSLDFLEMEPVPAALTAPEGAVVYNGNGSTLQSFINANGGKTIFIPAGVYNINSQLYFGVSRTKLQGAGMWYSQLNFTVTNASNGGLRANAQQVSYADLYITTDMASRTNGYAGILGVYTEGSVIKNMWVEHCATGAWIAQYVGSGPAFANGFTVTGCRFRNTYADGINLCKGTSNAIVEHCSFRNNGDDAMAVWCAEGLECTNNTFRFNTVENVWRASGCAIYGGYNNKAHHLVIKDNLEAGLRVNNFFPGVGFRNAGMHEFSDITVTGCGTFNDLWNSQIGAVDLACNNVAGTRINNVKFSNIDILDSKNDAIYIYKWGGEGFYNLVFENININGTGREYPFNNANNTNWGRGYGILFAAANLTGKGSYCNISYSNRGGNATTDMNATSKGTFTWSALTGCDPVPVTGVSLSPAEADLAGGATLSLVTTFIPANTTYKLVDYTSEDPSVATVTPAGVVTGVSIGQTTITVKTLDGGYTATSVINVTSNPVTCYKIKNRWQNTYLYDAGDRVRYSLTANNNTYLWKIEDAEGGKTIRNLSTNDPMHLEGLTGYVQSSVPSVSTQSTIWALEDTGDGFVRLKNVANPTQYIHMENQQNQAQHGTVETAWWSAMWALEPVVIVSSAEDLPIEKTLAVYPNPTNGDFNLSVGSFAHREKVIITVFNTAGQAIFRQPTIADDNGSIKVAITAGGALLQGNYYVVVKGESHVAKGKLAVVK